jgi:hypothetical protein
MASTVLQLIQQATAEMGLQVPTSVVGNLNQDTVQQLALINAVGNELQRQFIWQHSTVQYRFTTEFLDTTGSTTLGSAVVTNIPDTSDLDSTWQAVGSAFNYNVNILSVDSPTQVTMDQPCVATTTAGAINFGKVKYELPANFDRPVDSTNWDITKHWAIIGPLTAQQWEYLISGWIATGPVINWRLLAGYFQIWPVQTSADLLGFEYISSSWVRAAGAFEPTKSSFTVDTDTCVFPDRLMVLGLKKKYFETKNFDTAALTRDYQEQLSIAFANDQGSGNLAMAQQGVGYLINWSNIPDSGYGSPH